MVDVDSRTVFMGFISLIVAGVLQRTLLSAAFDVFFEVDTSAWTWETVVVWNLLPTVAIAAVIFVAISGLINGLE